MQQLDFNLKKLLNKLLYQIPNAEIGSIVLNDGYLSRIILVSSNQSDNQEDDETSTRTYLHTIQDFTQQIIPDNKNNFSQSFVIPSKKENPELHKTSKVYSSMFKVAKAQIVFPLIFERKIIGEIQIENHISENAFNENDIELVARSTKIINLLFYARINQASLADVYQNIINLNNIVLKKIDSDVNKLKNVMQIVIFILEMNIKKNPNYSQVLDGLYAMEETRSVVLEQTVKPISNNIFPYSVKETLVETFPYIKEQSPQVHSILVHAKGNAGKNHTDTKIYLGKKLYKEDSDILKNYKRKFPLLEINGSNVKVFMDWYSLQTKITEEEKLFQTEEFFFKFALYFQNIIINNMRNNNNSICLNLKSQEMILKNMIKPFFNNLKNLQFDNYSIKWRKSLNESKDLVDSLLYCFTSLKMLN